MTCKTNDETIKDVINVLKRTRAEKSFAIMKGKAPAITCTYDDAAATAVTEYYREHVIAKVEDENKRLREALVLHHKWHCEVGTMGLPDGSGGFIEMDMSLEYSDSSMCLSTCKALEATNKYAERKCTICGYDRYCLNCQANGDNHAAMYPARKVSDA